MNKGGTGKPWWVWLTLWAGTVLSVLSMLLYILILDIDIPSIKPRPALENAVAAMVYITHAINIIASALTGFAILQQEYVVVLCWVLWSAVHIIIMVLLTILSCFTVLPYIPARILLHIVCAVVSIISGLVMLKVYNDRYRRNDEPYQYDWRSQVSHGQQAAGQVNKMDLSRESNVL